VAGTTGEFKRYPDKLLSDITLRVPNMTASVVNKTTIPRKEYRGATGSELTLETATHSAIINVAGQLNSRMLAEALRLDGVGAEGVARAANMTNFGPEFIPGDYTITFGNIGWGAGAGYALRTHDDLFLVSVLRNPGASICAGMLGSLSGTGDSSDPVITCYAETSERVILGVSKRTAIMPVLCYPYSGYNQFISRSITSICEQGRQKADPPFEFAAMAHPLAGSARFRNTFRLNHGEVKISICYRTENERDAEGKPFVGTPMRGIEITAPPIVIDLGGSYNIDALVPRETLAIATDNKIKELPVVLMGLTTGRILLFNSGKLEGKFDSMSAFLKSGVQVDQHMPIVPSLANTIEGMGDEIGKLNTEILGAVSKMAIPFGRYTHKERIPRLPANLRTIGSG
jgi:hypothetical protein